MKKFLHDMISYFAVMGTLFSMVTCLPVWIAIAFYTHTTATIIIGIFFSVTYICAMYFFFKSIFSEVKKDA